MCSSTDLNNAITQIQSEMTSINTSLSNIETARVNVREAINCKANTGIRNALFQHYEDLYKRKVIITQVYIDLQIKKDILSKELARCSSRSKCILLFQGWLSLLLENNETPSTFIIKDWPLCFFCPYLLSFVSMV